MLAILAHRQCKYYQKDYKTCILTKTIETHMRWNVQVEVGRSVEVDTVKTSV